MSFLPAIIGGATSLAGNLFGFFSNRETNKSNKDINQLNNAFNERMMNKSFDYNTALYNQAYKDDIAKMNMQNAYNTQMFNQQYQNDLNKMHIQNTYNSAEQQRKRFEQAGMNPYLMMGGASLGSASGGASSAPTSASGGAPSASGVSAASAGSPGNARPFNFDFSGIPDAIMQGKQGKIMDEQYKQWVMDNSTRAQRNIADLNKVIAETSNERIKHKLSTVQYRYADELQQLSIQNMRQTNENMIQQQKNMIQEGLLMQKELDIFDERTKLEFSKLVADRLFTAAQTRTEKQKLVHEVQKMYETVARTNGIKISNDVAKRSAESLVIKAYRDAYSSSGVSDFVSKGIFGGLNIIKSKLRGTW